jgi:hypothetical protein
MARRKRSRRVRRNTFKGHRKAHSRAARRGWSRRRRRASNPHRRYRRGRRGRRFNPIAATGSLVGSLTSGFRVDTLKTAGVLVAGGIANAMLSRQLISLIPVDFLKAGMGSYATRLASAGLLSGIVRMVAPRYSGEVLTGAVMQVALKAVGELLPAEWNPMSGLGDYLTLSQVQQARPLAGLGDYLTSQQVATARPLMTGMGYGSDDWLQGAADSFENGAF